MATDIAFAIGVLALVGRAVPTSVKAFLLAVAIVDDLGAVLVIALFYTSKISVPALGATGLLFLGLTMLNLLRVHRPFPYLVLGTGLWIAILLSGLHATLAGVLLAVTIPAIRQFEELPYVEHVRRMLDEFERDVTAVPDKITESQSHAIKAMEEVSQAVQTPLALLEHALLKPVSFVIVPVFALANAGVNLGDASAVQPTDPVLWGVLLGLLVGKPVGVLLGSWLAIKGRFAAFPEGAKWHHLAGVSVLCGIGFTMSLFVGNLAFSDDEKRLVATKVAILLASSASALAGALLLKVGQRLMKEPSAQ